MTSIQSQSTSNPSSISQKAAVAALTGPQEFVSVMHTEFDRRRKVLVGGLNAIDGISCTNPTGAFYAFPNVSKLFGKSVGARRINSSLDVATYLLEEANIALVHGGAFGDDKYIRISYATSMDTIRKGLERIGDALSRVK
jgi:aspartate aminotransferase